MIPIWQVLIKPVASLLNSSTGKYFSSAAWRAGHRRGQESRAFSKAEDRGGMREWGGKIHLTPFSPLLSS
jgi:hypothetical protein